MQVLQLTLKRKLFDLIASGKKTFEYREYKDHWKSRLLCHGGTRDYDEIIFTNGYGKHRPYIRCEYIGMVIMPGIHCHPKNKEPLEPDKMYFVIALGKIIEIGPVK